jgi:hypothetical protein
LGLIGAIVIKEHHARVSYIILQINWNKRDCKMNAKKQFVEGGINCKETVMLCTAFQIEKSKYGCALTQVLLEKNLQAKLEGFQAKRFRKCRCLWVTTDHNATVKYATVTKEVWKYSFQGFN